MDIQSTSLSASSVALLAAAKQLHPLLDGEVSLSGGEWMSSNAASHGALAKLHQHWRTCESEAGSLYWSSRCWSMLIWQPLYLAVAAVHGAHALPNLGTIKQRLNQGVIAGFYLADHPWMHGDQQSLIEQATQQINTLIDSYYRLLQTDCPLKPRMARRLAADTLLIALLELPRLSTAFSANNIESLATTWLSALGWQHESALMRVSTSHHRQQLALNRKACCFEYLASNKQICATCPRQSIAKRKARITHEALSHA